MNTHSIQIFDNNHKSIGELMTATDTDIMKFINKGFIVVDRITNQQIILESVNQTVGVSDGVIDIG